MPDLLAMLANGPVVCAEGYLFECERRGYLQAGAFVPEVVLEHHLGHSFFGSADGIAQSYREYAPNL